MTTKVRINKWNVTMFFLLFFKAAPAQDSLTIHFGGVFEKSTTYLMIYKNDTVCIQVNSGAFNSYYKVELPTNTLPGEFLPISIWYISKIKRKHRFYKDSGLKVMYKGKKDVWITNEVYNGETFVFIGNNQYLDYYW